MADSPDWPTLNEPRRAKSRLYRAGDSGGHLIASPEWFAILRPSSIKGAMQVPVSYSRRRTGRVDTPDGVWVYWRYAGRDDASQVQNLGVGGLFIETDRRAVLGAKSDIDFLVQEGQIRAEATIKHVEPGKGIGLKFTGVKESDHRALAALLSRLGSQEKRPIFAGGGASPSAHA